MSPILYSFRRCPYAMRARLAIEASGVQVELREILLKDKPPQFLQVSASGTVPCLVTPEGPIDESLDIMKWALAQADPESWLAMPEVGWRWIDRADTEFKRALDRTKYASRHPDNEMEEQRAIAAQYLSELDAIIEDWIFENPTIADYAILPFVRQFAFVDKTWFDAQPWPNLHSWLERFLQSERFAETMQKHQLWVNP